MTQNKRNGLTAFITRRQVAYKNLMARLPAVKANPKNAAYLERLEVEQNSLHEFLKTRSAL